MTKWASLQLATPSLDYTPGSLFLSDNAKTGLSINVSIARSCRPTKACAQYCYGLESRIRLPNALIKQVENYDRFEYLARAPEEELHREVCAIAHNVLEKQDFLRFFGVGDLQPGSLRFINALADEAPELSLWVSTRKLDLAARLTTAKNVFTMLSADDTSKTAYIERALALTKQRKPNFFMAWVQTSAVKPPNWSTVVFAEHHMASRAAFTANGNADPKTCPATVKGGATHTDSCQACRFCFDAKVRRKLPRGPNSK